MNNLPAFPITGQPAAIQTIAGTVPLLGLSKREVFTAFALMGAMSAGTSASVGRDLAERAVFIADLTLEELAKKKS